MRAYEKDDIKLPKIVSWMSAQQLRKLSNIVYRFSKRAPQKRRTTRSKIKYYI